MPQQEINSFHRHDLGRKTSAARYSPVPHVIVYTRIALCCSVAAMKAPHVPASFLDSKMAAVRILEKSMRPSEVENNVSAIRGMPRDSRLATRSSDPVIAETPLRILCRRLDTWKMN